ncbi:DUF4291 family protein [Enterobacter sp. Bisph1]|uniref:DUF4291 family protein n=1 Tax=Enterobacter sp. Bisph1 TaxID=1274399 RepID=UPI0018CE42D4
MFSKAIQTLLRTRRCYEFLRIHVVHTDPLSIIKPSFVWTFHRSGWGKKHVSQLRILTVDLSLVELRRIVNQRILSDRWRFCSKKAR